jgi:tetratricopeptide (TPR) repeat protein
MSLRTAGACAAGLAVALAAGWFAAQVHLGAKGRSVAGLASDTLAPDTIVARLSGPADTPRQLREAVAAARARPDDAQAARAAARAYLDHGRRQGDARYAGAALSVLEPWLADGRDPTLLNLAASARQYRHDFTGALELLDRVLAKDPFNAQALLSRANLHVVQGRLRQASGDCSRLVQARRIDLGVLCGSTAAALSTRAGLAYDQLGIALRSPGFDPALAGYAQSLLAEIAWYEQRHDAAAAHFAEAIRISPDDLRTRLIHADFLLSRNDAAGALTTLGAAPEVDSVLVRRVLALRALGRSREAAPLRDLPAERFARQALIGETAHAREEARFWLRVENDPERALAAAQRNWANQRELEDALLLIDAAVAAGEPAAAKPVSDWALAEGVVSPALQLPADLRMQTVQQR